MNHARQAAMRVFRAVFDMFRTLRRRGLPALAACLLPLLCSGCSWLQAWQDNLKTTPAGAPAQAAPLPVTEVPVRMLFPHGTQTTEEAVSYLLEPHNYHPANRDTDGNRVAQRRFINNFGAEPVTLRLALQRLLGPTGQIILDSDSKRYTYRPRTADEPSVVLADLSVTTARDRTVAHARPDDPATRGQRCHEGACRPERADDPDAGQQQPPDLPAAGTDRNADNADTGSPPTWRVVEAVPAAGAARAVDAEERCRSIQFSDRAMLSATVREYFLSCGFDDVSWHLGGPGRYADYRLTQSLKVPLPDGHQDLIELLHARFGIRTLIHDNNQVEFHDEDSTL